MYRTQTIKGIALVGLKLAGLVLLAALPAVLVPTPQPSGYGSELSYRYISRADADKRPWGMVVDARSPHSFYPTIYLNSLHIPPYENKEQLPMLLRKAAKGDPEGILVFCSPGCRRAETVAKKLIALHCKNVYVLDGGYTGPNLSHIISPSNP